MIEAHAATEMQALCGCTKHAKELVELGFSKTSVASWAAGLQETVSHRFVRVSIALLAGDRAGQ